MHEIYGNLTMSFRLKRYNGSLSFIPILSFPYLNARNIGENAR